jgi:hypothetical protein
MISSDRLMRGLFRKRLGLAIGLSIVLLLSCKSGSQEGSVTSSEAVNPQRLVGQWVRPDGGYILEINRVRTIGKLEARYLNPRPIHIETAELRQDGQDIGVFIELKDEGYPGSYYELMYYEGEDVLKGKYFQATQRAVYEVVFVRRQ